MDNEATLRTAATAYFEMLNAENWDGMRSLWHRNGELSAVGARPRTGVAAVMTYFRKIFDPWPEHRDEPTRLLICEREGAVVAELRFTGRTHDGPSVTFDAVDVFDIEGGQIRRMTSWYDIAAARRATASRADACGDPARAVGPETVSGSHRAPDGSE
jgi:ketosteroid isomerase-like protein